MPPIELLTGQPAAMVLALVMLFLLNRNYLESLKERSAWLKREEQVHDRLWTLMQSTTEANVRLQNELHQLRNDLTRWMISIEQKMREGGDDTRTDKRD